ncbi:hypothetical protein SO802_025839 [Lithocarpus litseifolius]|uniref:Uncharacterized protein n=1 Tax=Lithocarpus litseifolius TaxID=425828 RepID=A0AAW2C190_9ROSI
MISTATPPFSLGYKLTDDDLLEIEVKKMARAKAKAKGLLCSSEPPKALYSNIERKHALKSSYEVRTSDEDEEGGAASSDDDEGSDAKSDSSSDSSSSDIGHGDDDSSSNSESNNSEDYDSQYKGNDWGKPLNDRKYEDDALYYEEYDDDVTIVMKILKMMMKPTGRVTLIVTNTGCLRILTLENAEGDKEKMERSELEHLPQHTHLSNKRKQDLFGEWMDSIEHLDAFVTDKPTDMEIDDEATDYVNEDP